MPFCPHSGPLIVLRFTPSSHLKDTPLLSSVSSFTLTPALFDGTDVQNPPPAICFLNKTGLSYCHSHFCLYSASGFPSFIYSLASLCSAAPTQCSKFSPSGHSGCQRWGGSFSSSQVPGHDAENPLWFLPSSTNSASQIQILTLHHVPLFPT